MPSWIRAWQASPERWLARSRARSAKSASSVSIQRDFVGYGPNPPRVQWPECARLALNIVINYEEGSERTPADGDAERELMSESVYPAPPGERELIQETVYEFGSRAGVWRIL